MKNNNILIISAHADDHLFCAGTVFKLKAERGMTPFEIILTDFSKGQDFRSKAHQSNGKVQEIRGQELDQASKCLGVKETFLLNQPDFGLVPSPDLIHQVAGIIRQVKPKIVFLLGATDMHPDHKAAFRIGIEAIKFASFDIEEKVYGPSYRVPTILCTDQELPNSIHIIVDVTPYLKKKAELYQAYQSQMSPKAMAFEKGMLAVRGYHLSNKEELAAEAFSLQSEFPIIGFENKDNLF